MAEPLDLEAEHPVYYRADPAPREIELGTIPYLTIQGTGSTVSPSYPEAAEALDTLTDAIRQAAQEKGRPFLQPPLETQQPLEAAEDPGQGEPWWTLLRRMPGFVHADLVEEAKDALPADAGKRARIPRYETLGAGPCVQALHLGSRETIDRAYERIKGFLAASELSVGGPAHEIHLDGLDPGEGDRTIVRLPVEPS